MNQGNLPDFFPKEIPLEEIDDEVKNDEAFRCPLSLNVMQNPAMTKCGHTFEKSEI